MHPHRAAEGNQLVVEVVARVVQDAGPLAVTRAAVRAIAVADDEVAARLLQQEVAEILSSHRRLELLDVLGAHELTQQLAHEASLACVNDGGWVVARER